MTNEKTNEKEAPEWYEDGKYWVPQPERYGHHWPKLNEIVAEAERRGEVKAWREAKEIVHEVMDCSDDTIGYYEDSIQKNIDTKLTSLKTP